jgi:hypothetical protein
MNRGSCETGIILGLCFRNLTWTNYCTFAAHAWGGGDVLSDHLFVGTFSISRMRMSSKTSNYHVWTFPISTYFLVGRRDLKSVLTALGTFSICIYQLISALH